MRLVLVLVIGLFVVGCTPGGEVSPSPSVSLSPTVHVEPSPSPAVVSPSPTPSVFQSYPADLPTEDAVSAAIIDGWQEYQRVLDKFLADPHGFSDFSETQIVTTGEHMNTIIRNIEVYREHNIRSVGRLSFDDLAVGEVRPSAEGTREADLSYCVDRTQAKAETYDGEPFGTGELIPRFPEVATMVEGLDGIWRVGLIRNREEPC
ncbi:MAG: hypothetical protein Q4G70_05115 [Pseudomonadota bacterium]|nr:hypothetical protein [Pseudomonadota bacterium]